MTERARNIFTTLSNVETGSVGFWAEWREYGALWSGPDTGKTKYSAAQFHCHFVTTDTTFTGLGSKLGLESRQFCQCLLCRGRRLYIEFITKKFNPFLEYLMLTHNTKFELR